MNKPQLATIVRGRAEQLLAGDRREEDFDNAELLCVLARVLEGKSIERAFGAPGDWGYNHPIGKAVAEREVQP